MNSKSFLNPGLNHPQQVASLVFNHKGDRLITSCDDKLARVFAVGSAHDPEEPLYSPVAHSADLPPALVDEDRSFITQSGDAELTRWELSTGNRVSAPIHTKPTSLRGVVASGNGGWFATGGYYGPELYSADAKTPPVLLGHTNMVSNYAFSPDDSILLSVGIDQTARLWSIPDGRPIIAPIRHMANVDRCAWSSDSIHFATLQNDGLVRVWELPTDDLILANENNWGQRPRVSTNGSLAAPGVWHETAMGGLDQGTNRLRVVRTEDGKPASGEIALPGGLIDSCVTSDNLSVAAVWSRGSLGQLGVWDLAESRARFTPISLPGTPLALAARPASGQLAVICSTGDLLVFDNKTGKRLLALRHEAWETDGNYVQLQYTADGKTLVSISAGGNNNINVRDSESGRLRFAPFTSNVHGSNFHSFTLSPDSRLIATLGLVKNAIEVWDLQTGRAVSSPLPHPGDYWGLFSVRFSPDGDLS